MYVAGPDIEPAISGSLIRRPTDCATRLSLKGKKQAAKEIGGQYQEMDTKDRDY